MLNKGDLLASVLFLVEKFAFNMKVSSKRAHGVVISLFLQQQKKEKKITEHLLYAKQALF